jgi:hypothetical protein
VTPDAITADELTDSLRTLRGAVVAEPSENGGECDEEQPKANMANEGIYRGYSEHRDAVDRHVVVQPVLPRHTVHVQMIGRTPWLLNPRFSAARALIYDP